MKQAEQEGRDLRPVAAQITRLCTGVSGYHDVLIDKLAGRWWTWR
ncbi:MAG: hypothetical protein WCI17_10820 [bacterium]